ncbi:MAG: chaperone modulator CbpM [Gammaproteobacteria bacterium]|nr:chaperone modulator CbpM [Gammaproteobacteria bacterium]
MKDELLPPLSGDVLDEEVELTFAELCHTCCLPAEEVLELVDEGVVEPLGGSSARWRFQGACVRRVRSAVTLRRDLGVNWAGAALALELLEELESLRARVDRLGE